MKKLIKYLKPYTFFALISPLMMACEVGADLLLPYLTSFIINYGISGIPLDDPENGSQIAARIVSIFCGDSPTGMQMIVTFGLLMLGITLVGGFFGTMCAYTAARAAQGFGNDLRCDAYRHVMALSVEQTDKFTTGSLVTRMTNDVTRLVELVESVLRMFVRAPVFFIGGTIMLLLLNVDFGLVLIGSLPLLLITMVVILKKAIPMFSVMQTKLDRVNSVVQEDVSGARVIKAYVREDYECGRFDRANRELCDTNLHVMSLMTWFSPILSLILNFSVVALFLIGGSRINAGNTGMSAGAIMAAITYVTQVIFSLMQVAMMFQSMSRARRPPSVCARCLRLSLSFSAAALTIPSRTVPVPPLLLSCAGSAFAIPARTASPCSTISIFRWRAARLLPLSALPDRANPRFASCSCGFTMPIRVRSLSTASR